MILLYWNYARAITLAHNAIGLWRKVETGKEERPRSQRKRNSFVDAIGKEKLAGLLRDAEKAHGEYEKKLGRRDDNWTEWYAEYIITKMNKSYGLFCYAAPPS